MRTLNHAFFCSIGYCLCLFFFLVPAYSKTINIGRVSEVSIGETLRLGRFVLSAGEKNVFFAIGFSDKSVSSPYSVYTIIDQSVRRTVDLPIVIEESPNPYLHIEAIKLFRLINNLLFIGIKKLNGDLCIAVVDIQEPHKLHSSINFKSKPESSLLLDDKGNFYLADIGADGVVTLQKIKENIEANQGNTQGHEDSASSGQITSALYHDGFFYLALSGIAQEFVQTTLLQIDVNGTIHKKTSIGGMVFKILAASEKNILLIRSFGLEGNDSDALLYSTDFLHIKSFKAPHFYELIRYPGSIVGLSDGSLLYLRESLSNSIDSTGDYIEVLRYSYESPPLLVARINRNKKQSKIINIMNEITGQNMTVVTLEMVQEQEKLEMFFDAYVDIDVSGVGP